MRRFTMYRRFVEGGVTPDKDVVAYNKPDEPTLEGVLFSDGKVAVRWLTARRSTVVWDSFGDFWDIHVGIHPDYGTEFVWHDAEKQHDPPTTESGATSSSSVDQPKEGE